MSPTRVSVLGVSGLVALAVALALPPARGQQIHRHQFSGRQTALVRADANVRAEEKEHDISAQAFHSAPTSEHVKLACEAGAGDAAFVHYFYETPPAPVSEALSASVYVKATKPGIQLRARVVFPKEPDPNRPEAPLTMLVVGETYEQVRGWQKLSLGNVPQLVGKHLPVRQAEIRRPINTADAYIDRLVLNLYAGPGPVDVWIDDLDIGPVRPAPQGGAPGMPVGRPKGGELSAPRAGARQVEHRDRQIMVDGKPYLFRAFHERAGRLAEDRAQIGRFLEAVISACQYPGRLAFPGRFRPRYFFWAMANRLRPAGRLKARSQSPSARRLPNNSRLTMGDGSVTSVCVCWLAWARRRTR